MNWYPIATVPKDGRRLLVTDGENVWWAYWAKDIALWEREEREGLVVYDCEDFFYTWHLLDEKLTAWGEVPSGKLP